MTLAHQPPARQDTCRAGAPSPDSLRAEKRANWRRRQRRLAQGLPGSDLVDAQPVRDHIRNLQAGGMSIKGIAAAADVSYMTINRVLYTLGGHPPARRILPESAAAILAVRSRPELLARPPNVGTRRRLQALIALGWTFVQVADAMGWSPKNLRALAYRDGVVHADTYRKACHVYDRMWNRLPVQDTAARRGAATRARNVARRNGWPPPQAWDDATIDDPAARPAGNARPAVDVDELAVADLVAGRITADSTGPAEREAAVAQLTKRGLSAAEIAVRIGMHQRSVVRLRGKAS